MKVKLDRVRVVVKTLEEFEKKYEEIKEKGRVVHISVNWNKVMKRYVCYIGWQYV